MLQSEMKEIGAPIMVRTNCRVGLHTWTWAGGQSSPSEPDPFLRCDCGLYTWIERAPTPGRAGGGEEG
jgi:hypothetical protein